MRLDDYDPMDWLKRFLHLIVLSITACSALLLPACQPAPDHLAKLKQRGELVVATQLGPTTYFKELDQETGFEFELAKAFADFLGVKLIIKPYKDLGELLHAVQTDEVHMAAAGLSITPERNQALRFTTPYQNITQFVIYHPSKPAPKSITDLIGNKLAVIANSNHSEHLERIKIKHPALVWDAKTNASNLTLLNMVNDGQADYTIMDSNVFLSYRDVFPELKRAFQLKNSEALAWAFPKKQDASLTNAAEQFLELSRSNGRLALLHSRFFEHQTFNYVSARTFLSHMGSRLPLYKEKFRENAKQLDIDWRLLAAIGYQESLWNPNAISPTGVRGLMMLTRNTAKEMGVANRRDPFQSIQGGSHYFKKLYSRLPKTISEPHRTWFALAAYNVGYGHLMDARRLTQQEGKNPNNWFSVKKMLPLLLQKKYFSKTRYGYARSGAQSVYYVRNIRRYYETLVWATERNRHRYTPAPQTYANLTQVALVH